MKDTMVDGPEGADGAAFAQALSALKERGSNLLVVGGALEGAHSDACDRLLGEDAEQPRRRVFVRTDGTTGCLPGPRADSGRTQVVARTTATRGAAAGTPAPGVPTREVAEADLGELATSVDESIADVAPVDGFDPAELRVCFDSLLPLLSDHEEEPVFRMLSLVTARVRSADGMGHYHLPVDADEETVDLLAPLFDAVIELRMREGAAEHNWRLVDRDVESGWLPL